MSTSETQPLKPPPEAITDSVMEVLHGVKVSDPYRWLEDQNSPRTRQWLQEHTQQTRAYMARMSFRENIRRRVQELLSVETYEVPWKVGNRYFFRRRDSKQEQPCIYMRDHADGADQLLVDPAMRGTGQYTSVSISHISLDAKYLVYEIKQGGERFGSFEIFDVNDRTPLPDRLPRGILRGFAFAPDRKSFYYVHEVAGASRPHYRAVYQHVLGTVPEQDREVFFVGEDPQIKLTLQGDDSRLCFAVTRYGQDTSDYYLWEFSSVDEPRLVLKAVRNRCGLIVADGRVFAVDDNGTPNLRIQEIANGVGGKALRREIVPETTGRIHSFLVRNHHLLVKYMQNSRTRIVIYDLDGKKLRDIHLPSDGTATCDLRASDDQEVFYSFESFRQPPTIYRYLTSTTEQHLWSKRQVPFDPTDIVSIRVWYSSKDGTRIPMYLVGRKDVLDGQGNPTILTGYGGFGVSMTPRFGILTSFMIEKGCLFALSNLRGGTEFGEQWHVAAQGRNRQKAFDDFLSAAEWLIEEGHTAPDKLAIFGGSNSGLLMGVALTQRPDLFRAVLCIGPLMDMLRYHLFDFAQKYKFEYGIAADPDDFRALYAYSPYHRVHEGTKYPAVLMVSGDADMNCNPMHARKLVARLQAATASEYPILLDYKPFRGHKPVLPLSERIEGLTDRLAFLCDQLGIAFEGSRQGS